MPAQQNRTGGPTLVAQYDANGGGAPSSPAGSAPRDWSDLGRRVLAEALRRATDELAPRSPQTPTPACSRHPAEGRS